MVEAMDTNNQAQIARKAGITPSFLSYVLSGQRTPSWETAQRLAEATGTDPLLWISGVPEARRAIVAVLCRSAA